MRIVFSKDDHTRKNISHHTGSSCSVTDTPPIESWDLRCLSLNLGRGLWRLCPQSMAQMWLRMLSHTKDITPTWLSPFLGSSPSCHALTRPKLASVERPVQGHMWRGAEASSLQPPASSQCQPPDLWVNEPLVIPELKPQTTQSRKKPCLLYPLQIPDPKNLQT